MKLKILNDDGTKTIYDFNSKSELEKDSIALISSTSKEQNAIRIIKRYNNKQKSILFDDTNKALEKSVKYLELEKFEKEEFSMMFFTSGSTGAPVGALKSESNLEEELKVFTKLVKKYNIKQVVVTVPFVHIYGALVGLLYPILNNIDIVLKEHFLPFNLLEAIEPNSLVVTTPLYIKALNRVNESKDLRDSLFVSSTAPLELSSAEEFLSKFNTNLIQLFGSTESGGIAYKEGAKKLWTPLESVEISQNESNELRVTSPFVSSTLYESGFKQIDGVLQTFDYIEREGEKFALVGRSSKILKISGKRYSTVQIETILEDVEGITKSLVFVKKSDSIVRDEVLEITIESKKKFSAKEVKKILKEQLSNLKFSIELSVVDNIPTNLVGKKLHLES
ncbi:MAG: AMP-binding protein [Helicobacteraceae bacterium]|nr:AMP-binding protein [Helicobacteraceae bacterium]